MTGRARRARIGVDAGALVFPAGGVRRYVRELLAALPGAAGADAPEVDIVAVGTPAGVDLPPLVQSGPGVMSVPTNLARAAVSLPWAVRRASLDLFHAPAYTAPIVGGTPIVLTIHDVSYARRPEFYAHRSDRARQWFYRRSAQRAARIITDSDFSRREIVEAYGIADRRISVVALGVGAPFRPGRPSTPLPAGVREPYVLHVGDLHPRRNLGAAARAVIEIHRRAASLGTAPQLVCAGRDSGSAPPLMETFEAAGLSRALRLTGPVSETELVALYQGASAFLYPSLYEGFGLPVLEAMACGAPVVAMRAGSVPEVVGDAGVLVDEGDDRGLVEALVAVLTRPERAAALRERGLARAASFTWARTARETLGVYLACLGS